MRSRIRPLTIRDAPDLGRVEAAAWTRAYAALLPDRSLRRLEAPALEARWRRRLRGAPAGAWGVEEDGLVVAYAVALPARDPDLPAGFAGELAELYVHPGWQGRGLGRALLDRTWAAMLESGMGWGVLWVLRDNLSARAFYERCGLRPDGQYKRVAVRGGSVPAVRYARCLGGFDVRTALRPDPGASA